jgi:hypothetical protein
LFVQVVPSFLFLAFFLKILINMPLPVRFQKIDHQLGVVVISAKITRLGVRLGASAFGAKVLAHVGIDVDVTLAW